MTELVLPVAPVDGLELWSNQRDVLHDLFIYLDYMDGREVKRATRTNQLPKGDATRIARWMGDAEIEQSVKESGGSEWIDFIDRLALELGLVDYNIKGVYRGYTSSEPSYPDNYVAVVERAYREFLDLPPAAQVKQILERLVQSWKRNPYDSSNNEFYSPGVLSWLDRFSQWGAATGVMPLINFPAARTFLLQLLQQCEPDVWHPTDALVAYLKANRPHFLIPKKLPPDRQGSRPPRYANFQESYDQRYGKSTVVPDDAPDAFERVEGRYVERFLEGIPLTMGFVEVAYRPEAPQTVWPSLGRLAAFRVNERFQHLMRGEISPPRVTVQPNFELIIESELYPARLMQTLSALSEEVSTAHSGPATIVTMRLTKERVAAELVRNPGLDVVEQLRGLVGRDLPGNVVVELEEWSGHADQFILYSGFGLLESSGPVTAATPYVTEWLTSNFRLVRQAEKLVGVLEQAGEIPFWVAHRTSDFARLPEAAQTVFPRQEPPVPASGPQPVQLSRAVMVTVQFPAAEVFQDFRAALVEARCPIQADANGLTISFPQHEQARFEQVVQQLAHKYQVEINDGAGS